MDECITMDEKVIQIQLEANNKKEVLDIMSNMLKDEGYVKESYCDAIIEREKTFATGISTGEYSIAIPHTDTEHINKPMIAVATLKNPVKFIEMGSFDQEVSVKIIFMLAMTDKNRQVKMLSNLMTIVQDDKMLEEIYKIHEKEKMIQLLNSKLFFS